MSAADALSEEELVEMRGTFNLFDKDNDSQLNAFELGMAMRALGQHPKEKDLQEYVKKSAAADNEQQQQTGQEGSSGLIDFNDFLQIMAKKMGEPAPEDELNEAFRILDKDGSGHMSAAYLRHMMTTYGEKLTDEEVEEMIREADDDGDGVINYQEFAQTLLQD